MHRVSCVIATSQAHLETSAGRLALIGVHPVKSCRPVHPESWSLAETGLELDRAWMLIDDTGRFISQRQVPGMAVIRTTINEDHILVEHPDLPALPIPRLMESGPETRAVRLHQADRLGIDEGDLIANWFSRALGRNCRLVRSVPDVDPWRNPEPEGEAANTRFPDLYPVLVANTASLEASFPDGRFPMARFRPNLVIDSPEPFAEDHWLRLRIGDVELELVKPCARCKVTTIDQDTGQAGGPEPLQTLSRTRSWNNKAIFGWNALVRKPGMVRSGDPVQVLQNRTIAFSIGDNSSDLNN